MKYIDLSHELNSDTPAYPGDPIPEIRLVMHVSKDQSTDHLVKMGMHVATHMDAPMHMIADGKPLSAFGLEKFFGKGCLIDARNQTQIDRPLFESAPLNSETIVLVMTGCSAKFPTDDYYKNYPAFTDGAAELLVQKRIKIIGMDSPSPDRFPYRVHKLLLGNDILIIENLNNLESLAGIDEFEVIAVPPKIALDGAPTRVVAKL